VADPLHTAEFLLDVLTSISRSPHHDRYLGNPDEVAAHVRALRVLIGLTPRSTTKSRILDHFGA
jgi:hypothetical protein